MCPIFLEEIRRWKRSASVLSAHFPNFCFDYGSLVFEFSIEFWKHLNQSPGLFKKVKNLNCQLFK